MEVTRRGFLSLCVGLAAAATIKVPAKAQPISPLLLNSIYGKHPQAFVRYYLALWPDTQGPVEPGRVTVLRAKAPKLLRPRRIILSEGRFGILHLASDTCEPMLGDEVPSDIFMPTGFGDVRFEFANVDKDEEIVLAAVNRDTKPRHLAGTIACDMVGGDGV
jgi:hypothetical protein